MHSSLLDLGCFLRGADIVPLMKYLAVQPRLVLHLLLVVACVSTSASVCAQPVPREAPSSPRAEAGDLIRESDLKFRLEDENGDLVAVSGFTLEQFLELRALQNRIKEQQSTLPQVIFTGQIELDGRVDSEQRFARLEATFRIRLTPRADVEGETWTAIPLRLDGTFLDVGAIEHEEEGEIYVTRDEAAYVCWLLATPNSTHTIRVPIKVPIRRIGVQDSFSLALPNMTTTMRLAVNSETIEAFSPSGRSNVSLKTEGTGTVITVEGGGGELDLAWQQREQGVPH
ncbi:MAG TPA: hypothetical protein VMM76_28270, partial [Pirellulaceae bacterium]|nr:hypothetical protein [Pirellulaceae bacterium]